MKGIMILAHGSRRDETKNTVSDIAKQLEKKIGCEKIWIGYMEMAKPSIEESAEEMIQNGVDHIYAIPMFLFNGIHLVQDIPEELEKIKKKHPQVTITLGGVIGGDARLADILADRIMEAGYK